MRIELNELAFSHATLLVHVELLHNALDLDVSCDHWRTGDPRSVPLVCKLCDERADQELLHWTTKGGRRERRSQKAEHPLWHVVQGRVVGDPIVA